MKMKLLIVIMLLISIVLLSGCTTPPPEPPSGEIMVMNLESGKTYFELQEAIDDDATVNGNTLLIYDGDWYIYGPITVTKSLNIVGESKNRTTFVGPDESNYLFTSNGVDDIHISKMSVSNYKGINFSSGDNIVISDCKFYEIVEIYLHSSTDSEVINNITIKDCIFAGGWGSTIKVDSAETVNVFNCDITNTWPITISKSNGIHIYDNIITDPIRDGIQFNDVTNGTVTGNSLQRTGEIVGIGVYLVGCEDVNLDNNSISGFFEDVLEN